MTERSLADQIDTEQTEQPLSAETFDFAAFLGGVRPVTRRVKVHARGDLIAATDQIAADLNRLAEDLDAAASEDEQRSIIDQYHALLTELHDTRRAYHDSGVWFTVTSRSQEWIEEHRKAYAREHGLTIGKDGMLPEEHMVQHTLHMAADMITSPAGVTADGLAQLRKVAPLEVDRIATACMDAIYQAGVQSYGMTADFSLRPSTSPAGSAS